MILKDTIFQFPRKTYLKLFTKKGFFQQSTGKVMKNFPVGKPPDPRFVSFCASTLLQSHSQQESPCAFKDSSLFWHLEMTTNRDLAIAIRYIPNYTLSEKMFLFRKILSFGPLPQKLCSHDATGYNAWK